MQKDLDHEINYSDLHQIIENSRELFKLNQLKIKILYQKKNKENVKAKKDQDLKITIQSTKLYVKLIWRPKH